MITWFDGEFTGSLCHQHVFQAYVLIFQMFYQPLVPLFFQPYLCTLIFLPPFVRYLSAYASLSPASTATTVAPPSVSMGSLEYKYLTGFILKPGRQLDLQARHYNLTQFFLKIEVVNINVAGRCINTVFDLPVHDFMRQNTLGALS